MFDKEFFEKCKALIQENFEPIVENKRQMIADLEKCNASIQYLVRKQSA